MIDINLYRIRIGTYSRGQKSKKFLRKYEPFDVSSNKLGRDSKSIIQMIIKITLLFFLAVGTNDSNNFTSVGSGVIKGHLKWNHPELLPAVACQTCGKKQTGNYRARSLYGNKQTAKKGILNMHLNIRSLGNKVFEVKNIVKEHSPHILGLSECELKKVGGQYDESILKVPGYNLLFPKSWSSHGFARVVVYVKKTLEFEQVSDL